MPKEGDNVDEMDADSEHESHSEEEPIAQEDEPWSVDEMGFRPEDVEFHRQLDERGLHDVSSSSICLETSPAVATSAGEGPVRGEADGGGSQGRPALPAVTLPARTDNAAQLPTATPPSTHLDVGERDEEREEQDETTVGRSGRCARKRRIVMNARLCGEVVEPGSEGSIKCNQAGCETIWVSEQTSIKCSYNSQVSQYCRDCVQPPKNDKKWKCEVCGGGRASKRSKR